MSEITIELPIEIKFATEVVKDNYKYDISGNLYKKINYLLRRIKAFNNIRIQSIAHRVLVASFTEEYKKAFGTTIDGVVHHTTPDGYEYEEEINVPELQILERYLDNKMLNSLIINRYTDYYSIYFNDDPNDYVNTNEELVKIFNFTFNTSCDIGKSNKTSIDGWGGSVAEYMAYNIPFDKIFDENEDVIRKKEIRDEIIGLAKEVTSSFKKKVRKIVKKYEREVI